MKRIFALFLIIFALLGAAEKKLSDAEAIEKFDTLVKNKKYLTAYQLLEKQDPKNINSDILIKKTDLLLDYFVMSIMHQSFCLIDIKPYQDILDFRGKEGSYDYFVFKIDEELKDAIKKEPEKGDLYRALGKYYYEVNTKYTEWLISSEKLQTLAEENFLKAYKKGALDYLSLSDLGTIKLQKEEYGQAETFLKKSIALNKKYPSSYYNLGYLYMIQDKNKEAFKYAQKAFDLYDDKYYKADAARMMAVVSARGKDAKAAIKYYEESDKLAPNYYYTVKPLLALYLQKGNDQQVDQYSKIFFELDPKNPTIYNDLFSLYYHAEKMDVLNSFYEQQKKKYKNDDAIIGNILLYQGNITKDNAVAKELYQEAEKHFKKVFKKDHQVFDVLKKAKKAHETKNTNEKK